MEIVSALNNPSFLQLCTSGYWFGLPRLFVDMEGGGHQFGRGVTKGSLGSKGKKDTKEMLGKIFNKLAILNSFKKQFTSHTNFCFLHRLCFGYSRFDDSMIHPTV